MAERYPSRTDDNDVSLLASRRGRIGPGAPAANAERTPTRSNEYVSRQAWRGERIGPRFPAANLGNGQPTLKRSQETAGLQENSTEKYPSRTDDDVSLQAQRGGRFGPRAQAGNSENGQPTLKRSQENAGDPESSSKRIRFTIGTTQKVPEAYPVCETGQPTLKRSQENGDLLETTCKRIRYTLGGTQKVPEAYPVCETDRETEVPEQV